jgi:hypothetical protein
VRSHNVDVRYGKGRVGSLNKKDKQERYLQLRLQDGLDEFDVLCDDVC